MLGNLPAGEPSNQAERLVQKDGGCFVRMVHWDMQQDCTLVPLGSLLCPVESMELPVDVGDPIGQRRTYRIAEYLFQILYRVYACFCGTLDPNDCPLRRTCAESMRKGACGGEVARLTVWVGRRPCGICSLGPRCVDDVVAFLRFRPSSPWPLSVAVPSPLLAVACLGSNARPGRALCRCRASQHAKPPSWRGQT